MLDIFLLIYLIGVLLGSSSALFWTIVTSAIIALILHLEKKRKRSEKKRQEEELQRAIAEAHQRALVEARQRPNLFTFNPSTDLEDLSSYTQKKNPVQWAKAIQKRYEATKSALDDSVMVVNDDVEQLRVYREMLRKGVMKDYEIAIRPFKKKLALIEDRIPKSKDFKIAENYTFPESMQPKHIQESLYEPINSSMSSMGNLGGEISRIISNSGGFSNIKNVNKGAVAILAAHIGINLVIGLVNQKKVAARKLTEVQKLKADVDKYCVQMAGAIRSMGVAASEISYLRQLHNKAVDYMMQYYETVKELSDQGKLLDHLDENEIKTVESFYMGGKQLARLMQLDIMKSVTQQQQQ